MKLDVLGLLGACSYALDCVKRSLSMLQAAMQSVWHI